jgi:maltose O-acetyltransferase
MGLKQKIARLLHMGPLSVEELRARGAVIGENVYIGTRKIDTGHAFLIEIGNRVTISDARILTHDGSTKRELGRSRVGRVVIGDDVFVGADAILLPGVKVGSKVIIGAGAVVTHDIPDNSVAVGSPARVIMTYDEYIEKNRRAMETAPVYHTHYSEKTPEEIAQMKADLMGGGIGYDR